MVDGVETLGLKLTFDKRYITLAPVATVVGLAFRMYDPEHLLGDTEDLGITLALLPRSTPGMEIGRRHFPLNIPFQNGPVHGKDVFAPLSVLIGGPHMAGHGWRMLVECLSVGRAISLPSNATGGMRASALATGTYARMRKQFGLAVARFEGVEEALARIGGLAYATAALSRATAAAVDRGEKPAVTSAIAKYHATNWARQVASDTMDVHGGKAVQLGPKNYAARGWSSVPIAIMVEGANIMTRSLMIFGQGAIRCHPYVLKEMQALAITDRDEQLKTFDRLLFSHLGFGVSNAVRSLAISLTGSQIGESAGDAYTRRYYRKLGRYSAALALCADVFMGVLGGKLKFKEKLSARLGDVLSYLYIASSMLKQYEDNGRPEADRPFLAWGFHECMWLTQEWDLKRLTASVVIAAQHLRLPDSDAAGGKRLAELIETEKLKTVAEHLYLKLVSVEGALPRIKDELPLIFHPTAEQAPGMISGFREQIASYRESLAEHVRTLFRSEERPCR